MNAALLAAIRQILGRDLHPAPARELNPLLGLMVYKRDCPKYLFDGPRLIGLNLADTGLTDDRWRAMLDLPDFRLSDLQALNLSDNQLTYFALPATMTALQYLDLSGNQIREFSLPRGMDRLTGLNLEDNPLDLPPAEVLKQGRRAVLRFLRELAAQGEREIYEVKLLIVGEGGTGKTTLWNILQNSDHPVPDERQASTVGIGIREGWTFDHPKRPGIPFLVNLWDFGGQEIQYMTHQFFLTRRSFYVLLADGRREVGNFPYWFKIIDLLGCDPDQTNPMPVLVVLNERGNPIARMPYDPATVKADFPRLEILKREVDFAKKDDRFYGLSQAIQAYLSDLPHLPLTIPAYWDKVRQALYQLRTSANHIDFDRFKQICAEAGIAPDDEVQMTDLSRLLHDLGVVLHFHEDPGLRDFIVLSPEWAVNAVYDILRHEAVSRNQGRFDKQFLLREWSARGYSPFEQGHLLSLMSKDNFEVCFRAWENDREIYIAPPFLPEVQPDNLSWPPEGPLLRYAYQYPFMPKGIAGRLIVRLHEQLETRDGRKVVWEKGMVLAKDGCRAQVLETEDVDSGLKLIRIEVGGRNPEDRRYLLRDIRQELDKIHRRSFHSLKYLQLIPCCCAECRLSATPHFFELSHLQKLKDKGIATERCKASLQEAPVRELLGEVFPAEEGPDRKEPQPSSETKKIFFSYSRHDRPFLDELLSHLSVLRRNKRIRPWDDQRLSAGEEWDAAIRRELNQADIILVLLSHHALNTAYIWDVEIAAAVSRHQRGEARVIPIILSDCDWKDSPLGMLTALPAKARPIESWSVRNEAWKKVVDGIKAVIDLPKEG